ncbi:AAA family ATPase [Tenacibaculum ascidiaceicola]|uniref:AAA family ATPase n=1 Tax=Tenacibaculum ascidiaceicola TaxID=1699411 RepID=UPI003CE59126
MKFTYFEFKNFKGIEHQKLDLTRSAGSNIFTLVGLNESGKTTILEAINFFSYKQETLDVLELDSYNIDDIHSLIPINKRDNFNDCITIEAGLELSKEDIAEVKRIIRRHSGINVTYCSNQVSYTQKYHFKNSKHQKDKDESLWSFVVKGKKPRAKIVRNLTNDQKQPANIYYIRKNIPSILYFPNFLFEFPEKIYLNTESEDPKELFYQNIIQDVLDSLDNDLNIENHLIERIQSTDSNERRNLNSLIGKMNRKLSDVIFESWNQIFNKKLNEKEIILYSEIDADGAYLEFNIKDDVDTYRISERSLGFRWFFVYILLTQFRNYGKSRSNAFFLFDEPASNLHPAAQSELLKSFENLPNVLYTTHSHYLINPKWLESTYVVKNKGIDYENEEKYLAKNTDISIMKYREFASRFPSQTSYFQPILEILEYQPSNLELVPKVILTEGKNDFYTFSYYQQVIKEYKRPLKFIPGTSSSNLTNLISLYLGWGTNFVVLLDSDEAGTKSKTKYIEMFGDYIGDLIITYEDIDNDWTKFETEKLFSISDQMNIQKINYPDAKKINKKNFNRSIQEMFVTNRKVNLDRETLENFKKTIEYLRNKIK